MFLVLWSNIKSCTNTRTAESSSSVTESTSALTTGMRLRGQPGHIYFNPHPFDTPWKHCAPNPFLYHGIIHFPPRPKATAQATMWKHLEPALHQSARTGHDHIGTQAVKLQQSRGLKQEFLSCQPTSSLSILSRNTKCSYGFRVLWNNHRITLSCILISRLSFLNQSKHFAETLKILTKFSGERLQCSLIYIQYNSHLNSAIYLTLFTG